jgi:uncharacterized protein (TIGR03000 family)
MRTVARMTLWAILALGLTGVDGQIMAQGEKKPVSGSKTKISVTLPEDDAELFIEDKPTKATGLTREFETPNIDAGKTYEYKFTAKWRPNNYTLITRNKTVTFKGGEELKVDMTVDDPNDKAVIRFVPTPEDIVAKMVELAKITKDDVVYEPGCGDARILTAAVKAGAKKGIGIDLDPERIAEAKETVKEAKLENKIDIRQGDALEFKEFPEVTVVMLYMGEEFDALIRPHLWKNLKIGSRIVSHRFTFGDWKPDKTLMVTGEDGDEYEVHLWTITKEVKDKVAKEKDGK